MGVSASTNPQGESLRDFLAGFFNEPKRPQAALVCVFAATLICLAAGIAAFWPYLIEEHRRITPWQWIPLWLGDIAAFCWFISAIISPRISLPASQKDRGDTQTRKRRRMTFLASMGIAIAIDLTHTAYAHWREAVDFATAKVVTGEVVANQIWDGKDTTRYYLEVRFRDGMNRVHQERIRVENVHIGGLPINTQKALAAGQVAFPVRVSFDPSLTARCWLTDVGYDDGDRIYVFSYLVLLFQFYAMIAFVALLHAQHSVGRDPWWESLYRPLPLIVTAFCLAFFAMPVLTNMRH